MTEFRNSAEKDRISVPARPAKGDNAIDILARTIWGEARGETVRGKEAVAATIINRVNKAKARGGHWWGATVEEVCMMPWQYSCWNANDPNREKLLAVEKSDRTFQTCLRVARRAVHATLKDPTNGATHYHHIDLNPWWAAGRVPCAEIGNHLFYKNIS